MAIGATIATPPSSMHVEIAVNLRDRCRAFSDGRGDALDRPGANVADREHARRIGLRRKGAFVVAALSLGFTR